MTCPHCGRSIPHDSPARCPFCGANISALQSKPNNANTAPPPAPSADPQTVLTGAFKTVLQRFGPEAMNDGGFIMANISQMGPDTARFAPLVDAFLRCGGNVELMAAREAKSKARAKDIAAVIQRMAAMQVHEADAGFICNCFCDAVMPAPAQPVQTAQAPASTAVSPKTKAPSADKPRKKAGRKTAIILICLVLVAALVAAGLYLVPKLMGDDDSAKQEQTETGKEDANSKNDNDSDESSDTDDEGDTAENSPNTSEGASPEHETAAPETEATTPADEENIAEAPSAEEGASPQEGTVQAPEVPAEEEPDEPQTNSIVIENEYYSVTLPDSWDGLYCDEHRDNGRISFYEINAYEAGFGGHVFSITLQDSDYTYLPAFQILGKLTTRGGKVYDVVALFPTDVQAMDGHFEEYSILYEQTDTILDSFTPQPGCHFEPKSTTSVLRTYINTMLFIDKSGKLWLHENAAHSDGNKVLDDYTAPGYIERHVRDNQGNTYTYGLHLDGYGANTFYITYDLCGVYSTFSGTCILPDTMVGTGDTKYFQIYCDDVLVFTSETMEDGCQPQDFTIDVTGVHHLTIVYPPTAGSNETAVLADGLLQ